MAVLRGDNRPREFVSTTFATVFSLVIRLMICRLKLNRGMKKTD
jgi:hypothetical protein